MKLFGSLLLNLLAIKSVSAQVQLFSSSGSEIAVVNSTIRFSCFLLTASGDEITAVEWLLNGSTYRQNLDNVMTEFEDLGNGRGALTFSQVPLEYNATTVQCMATISPHRPEGGASPILTLLVQGDNLNPTPATAGEVKVTATTTPASKIATATPAAASSAKTTTATTTTTTKTQELSPTPPIADQREARTGSELGLGVLIGIAVGISLAIMVCVLAGIVAVVVRMQYRRLTSMNPVQAEDVTDEKCEDPALREEGLNPVVPDYAEVGGVTFTYTQNTAYGTTISVLKPSEVQLYSNVTQNWNWLIYKPKNSDSQENFSASTSLHHT